MRPLTLLTRAAIPALVLTAAALTPTSSSASGAERFFVPEEWDGTVHLSATENFCGPWAATFHEVRHGGYEVLAAPGGQAPGEVHVNGAVDGWVQLTPDDATLPTYTGTYREKTDGVVTDPATDTVRVSQYGLRAPLTGSDGSSLVVVIRGKVTITPSGQVAVSRDLLTCE